MKTIKIQTSSEIPKNFTGIIEFPDGAKQWYKDGKCHRDDGPACEYTDGLKYWFKDGKRYRLDGPAVEFPDGYEEWWLENQRYYPLNLNNFVVLDYYQGKYDLMWYKFLGEDKVFEYPDIPGLIIKE